MAYKLSTVGLLGGPGYADPALALNAPALAPTIARSPLYASLFDRFSGADAGAYPLADDDKRQLFKQGLLQFAAAVSRPNGGNFANALANGLLAARGGMNEGAQQHANDAYRTDVMKRTQAEMAANTAKTQAWAHLYGTDGQIDPAGEAALRQADPEGYLAHRDQLHPAETAWQPKDVQFNGASGTVLWNSKTGEMRTLDGQPFGGGSPTRVADAPAPTPGAGTLADAVRSVESNGNPFAVSPKGAVGTMQTLPTTLRDPGFGVTPARDGSPSEQERVGRDYLAALTAKYGTQGGLAAYNWGPGHWDRALSQFGTPDAALAHAPAETRAYVPKVLGRMGAVDSTPAAVTASGTIPAASSSAGLPFGFAAKKPDKLSTVDQRKQDLADIEANGIPVTPSMRRQYLLTGKMPGEDGGAIASNPLDGLDPATAALVRGLSTYDVQPSSLGRAGNRADLIGRAAMLNPGYSEANAAEAYTFKKDLGRATPGSAGGQKMAANTLMHHLGTLLRANKALNDAGINSANPVMNKLSGAMSNQRGQAAVNNWNQAVHFVTEETAKLIKGGVATEGEVTAMLSNLDAAKSPEQRNQAIAQLAELAHGRLASLEQQRDDVLGGMASGVPIMSAESRKLYDATQRLRGGNGGTAPAAARPGDYSHLWGGN